MRSLRRLGLLPIIAIASTALAQDQGDWEFATDSRAKITVAALPTTTGVTVAIRCVDGGLEGIMTGLPAIEAEERRIGIAFADDPIHDQTWNVGIDNTMAVSQLPAPLARKLRAGGQMQIRFAGAGEGGRNLRYVIDLPPSQTAIDQTLTACGRPLTDPRDAVLEAVGENGLPANLEWQRVPRPSYPSNMRYAKGFAILTCMASPEGQLRDCVVETEHPRDGGFGRSAMDATRNARLTNVLNPDAPIDPERIIFKTNYYMEGYEQRGPRLGSRIRDRE